ncbi:Thiamin ABC transporter, transmembrane component [hydrothermal vent metagenome]|uniref:Thiamin ABC transporter, transmembrane component n=1 Tax=hydrothermal vent metagenome TaxID=652676 RepID=A0A1W1CBA1_9ZZZZ
MLKYYSRLTSSLIPGTIISIILLTFAYLLFYTLYTSQEGTLFTRIDSHIYGLLKFTLYQAFLSTILSLLVGVLLAWALAHQSHFRGRGLLVALFSSSLVLPTLIVVFGLIGIFGRNGYLNQASLFLFDHSFGSYIYGLGGILLAHVYLNASFASRALLHSFESIPKEKYKLAKSLNFSVLERFLFVEYPALKSTLLSIGSTIFLLCFTSFAVVLLLGGSPSYNTLEVAIYEAVKLDFDIGLALKLALIQLSISAVLVVLSSSFRTELANLKTSHTLVPWKESKIVRVVQWSIIGVFTLFFLLPLIVIFLDGIGADFGRIFKEPLFIKSLLTSLSLATASSILTVIIALFLSNARRNFTLPTRLANRPFAKVLDAIIAFSGNLYLAIPSLVLGLGFFLMYQKYEGSEILWSTAALMSANVLMSLPFALAVLTPAMHKTAQRYDKLAFSLGLSERQRWFDVEYPYIKSSLGYVFALAFCFSLGDLGIIALFGSDEFSTLPWYLYQLMGSYRTTDAAGVALVMLVLVLGVFVLLPRLFKEKA